ncbi:hypothetical protein FF100_22055 [Methylobacterium terricola]|uniref:Uncharacterized protein n=1 Tax=Methylobacterium terricola TaxID=2583531 RepID=A0A5C4LFA3_9HYPH|nr:hypothetical protein [Methylobacterium terricola]TNC10837.1 hypothetical protein FF100_22055 [Methylobacterium terricola]
MIGYIFPSVAENATQADIDDLNANPDRSNIVATPNGDGTYSVTYDWWVITDQDIADAILATLDSLDPSLSRSDRALAVTQMLRFENVLK